MRRPSGHTGIEHNPRMLSCPAVLALLALGLAAPARPEQAGPSLRARVSAHVRERQADLLREYAESTAS